MPQSVYHNTYLSMSLARPRDEMVPAFRAGGWNTEGDAQYTCRFCSFALSIDSLLMVLV